MKTGPSISRVNPSNRALGRSVPRYSSAAIRNIAFPLLAALLLGHETANADYKLIYESTGNPLNEGEFTILVKGDKTRFDSAKVSTITDASKKETIVLQHETKTVLQVPSNITSDVIKNISQPETASTPPSFTPTGRKENISGYACEEYTTTQRGLEMAFWIAKDFPLKDELMHQSAVLNKTLGLEEGAFTHSQAFPGFPIRTVIKSGTTEYTTTLKSASTETLPDSAFEIPAGYKQFDIPGGALPFEAK